MQDNITTEPHIIAVARDYLGLVAALRNRCAELKISYETLEALAGLTTRHVNKLLAPEPVRRFSPMSFDAVLGALGCRIALVDDPEQRERVLRHPNFRPLAANAPYSRIGSHMRANSKHGVVAYRITHEHLRQISQRGGKARAKKLTPAQRRASARKAARTRWAQRGADQA